MKKTFGCRLALMLALSTATTVGLKLPVAVAAPAPNFAPKDSGFSVWLPGKPQVTPTKLPIKGGKPINVKMYSLSSGPVSYVVLPVDLPATLNSNGVSKYLVGAEKGFVRSTGVKITSSKNITLNGYKGREISGELGTNVMTARFFAGKRRAFQIIAGSPKYKTVAQSAQIAKVLGSFRLAP